METRKKTKKKEKGIIDRHKGMVWETHHSFAKTPMGQLGEEERREEGSERRSRRTRKQ